MEQPVGMIGLQITLHALRAELAPIERKRFPVSARSLDAIIEAETREHLPQVVDVHLRSEELAAARARSGRSFVACLLVELDTELSRPLENVEEFPKRQIQ